MKTTLVKFRIMQVCIGIFVLSCFGLIACGGGSGSGDPDIEGRVTTSDVQLSLKSSGTFSLSEGIFSKYLVNSAWAQEDSAGVPLVDAVVSLIGIDGTVLATTETDDEGYFSFDDVDPGEYSISIVEESIEPLTIEAVQVLEGDVTNISGSVTASGGTAAVSFMADDCGMVEGNAAQMAHAENIANSANVPIEDVIAAREDECLGWGQIAQMFEVAPGNLGIGRSEAKGGKVKNKGPKDKDEDDEDDIEDDEDDMEDEIEDSEEEESEGPGRSRGRSNRPNG